MSTSIPYHAFNLRGISYKSTRHVGDSIIFVAAMLANFVKCPACGCRDTIFKGQKSRLFHLPPIGRKKCFLELLVHGLKCRRCGHIWRPQLPFIDGKHRYARCFALTVLDMLRFGTIAHVAEYLGVGWDMIKDIHKSKLSIRYKTMPPDKVKYLGIDEFSLKEGHKYMTIFMDLETGRILHAVEGRNKEAVGPFLSVLARKAHKLEAVSMDMSSSYFWAVRGILPHVDIVFDRYHVAALMNRAIDDFRRELQNGLEKTGKQTLKGSRFLLLKNYESLEDDHKKRLDALLKVNEKLFVIHSMKEQLRLFWVKGDMKSAGNFLNAWIHDALRSGIKQLMKAAQTIGGYRTCLLNYYKHRITNGKVEGVNNKIKTLKRLAYGFRDMEYFKLRLYHLHTQRYSLAG